MKVALTIAGSDPSGGAGIQADLKTFHQHGVYGMAVITLVTVQNTTSVQQVEILKPDLVRDQIRAVLDDIPPLAIKTGALGSASVIRAVAAELQNTSVPIIVDPVMISKHGSVLLDEDATDTLIKELLPIATLVTPNIAEAVSLARRAGLSDESGDSPESLEQIGRAIQRLGAERVLIKGGHREGDPTDLLLDRDRVERFEGRRSLKTNTHGTGCTLSAAITAHIAHGRSLPEAIGLAKQYVWLAIETAPDLGAGIGPLNHWAKPE